MSPRKVAAVVTARPSYSRVKTVLRELDAHPDTELHLVVAASALLPRYGAVFKNIEEDGFDIRHRVYMQLEGGSPVTMAKTTAVGILELATIFDNLQPDVVVTVADRYETLATAVAASYQNIPLAHVQGGEITGSIDEKVRHAVTKLADLHLVASDHAAERVIRMGEEPETVHMTGCPSVDLAAEILESPGLDFDPIAKYGGVGADIDISDGYIVVMQHPVTSEHQTARRHVEETLAAVAQLGRPTLWFWPNPDAGSDGTSQGLRAHRENTDNENIHFFKNMAPADFLRLLYNASCLVGNSSVGIRECAFLGVPVVNIGTRQAGRDRGPNVVDVPYSKDEIRAAIERQMTAPRPASDAIYGSGDAGKRIADVLATAPLSSQKRLTY
ncbi:MAG: UDP-N-acetylglucosamine 2-epimerase [Myxococcota bacterium]|nr:UDP-N-acetylglucosamine 2-epimerase [Myxococcota bacterium]